MLGAAARAEQRQLERLVVHAGASVDEDLAHARLRGGGQRAAGFRVHRHVAPARHAQAFFNQMTLQHRRRGIVVPVEKHQARREAFGRRDARLVRQRAQPCLRAADQHAAAVAAHAVGIHRAAVREFRQCLECGVDHPRAGAAIDLGHQAETAAVVLEGRVVQACSTGLLHLAHSLDGRARNPGGAGAPIWNSWIAI